MEILVSIILTKATFTLDWITSRCWVNEPTLAPGEETWTRGSGENRAYVHFVPLRVRNLWAPLVNRYILNTIQIQTLLTLSKGTLQFSDNYNFNKTTKQNLEFCSGQFIKHSRSFGIDSYPKLFLRLAHWTKLSKIGWPYGWHSVSFVQVLFRGRKVLPYKSQWWGRSSYLLGVKIRGLVPL